MHRLATAIALLAALGGDARTAPRDPPPGHIVYAADGALWNVAAAGDAEPVKLAALPAGDAEVRGIRASASGTLLVVDVGGVAGWVQPGDGVRQVALAPCTGPGRPAADGSKLVCPGGAETTVVQPAVWKARELDVAPRQVAFHGDDEILYVDGDGIAAVSARRPGKPRRLAPHAPTSDLLPSPDGTRAVGRYATDDGQDGLYTFQLDGEAARRKLGVDHVPIAWSPDSTWLLTLNGRLACVLRAVGGEYKCWRRYTPLGFSPDSKHILLERKGSLYVAPIAGVDAVRPKKVVDGATAGAWIP